MKNPLDPVGYVVACLQAGMFTALFVWSLQRQDIGLAGVSGVLVAASVAAAMGLSRSLRQSEPS